MNPLAVELNKTIQEVSPLTYELLSRKGKKLFFPTKGIVSQSAEAKEKADIKYNATIGIAMENGKPIGFPSIRKFFDPELANDQIFSYSSSSGNAKLRLKWKERLIALNPLLKDKTFSLPLVSAGLTHALYLASELFVDEGQTIVLPDQIWGNYRLMLNVIENANISYFPFFENNRFNVKGFKEALIQEGKKTGSVRTILNFPNNPTGYSPTHEEADSIVEALIEVANEGIRTFVILDEAYFGLFLENDVYKHSLFSRLADAHKNIFTAKICGATKELFAWGFRVGFITFATKDGNADLYKALEQKAAGNLRGSISNCSTSAQNIILKVLESQAYQKDFETNYNLFKIRVEEVKRVLSSQKYDSMFTPYPFNSGYFMLVKLSAGLEAEAVRQHLLEHEQVGVIATSPTDIRVAFSCLEKEHIQHVFDAIYKTCQTLSKT